jgi:AmmeMemoRadiSam system protein A
MNMVKIHGKRSIFGIFCFLLIVVLLAPAPGSTSASDRQKKPEETKVSTGEAGNKEVGMADIDKLTEEEGRFLLKVARQTIEQELFARKDQNPLESDISPKFSEQRGTFVTLTIQGGLRGCIGHIIPQESLIEGIRVNAINAAFRDPRFRPLTKDEWKRVRIEISILTDPKPLSYSDADDLLNKLRPGIDGVILKKGFYQSTFLPQVWEQLPGKEEFLTHLSLKAGLDGDEWRKGDLEVLTYQVQAFEE